MCGQVHKRAEGNGLCGRRELCSPRGVTLRYVLRGVSASPGGTESMIESKYKQTSVAALREIESVDRKKMTTICAKNNLSYKRAMAHFAPGERRGHRAAGARLPELFTHFADNRRGENRKYCHHQLPCDEEQPGRAWPSAWPSG